MSAQFATPLRDLPSAVAGADVIVVGTVRSVRWVPQPGGYVEFVVERALMGSPNTIISIYQAGGPMPSGPVIGEGGVLMYAENAPLLLTGDRAVLFLQRAGPEAATGTYCVQNATGGYSSQAGRITAVEYNPFRASVDGQTEQAFIADIVRLLSN